MIEQPQPIQPTQSLETSPSDSSLAEQIEVLSKKLKELREDQVSEKLELLKKIDEALKLQNQEKTEKESQWTREDFIKWVMEETNSEWNREYAEGYVDKTFDLSDLSAVRVRGDRFNAYANKDVHNIPPNLVCKDITFSKTNAQKLPDGLRCSDISVDETSVYNIPNGLKCFSLSMKQCPLREVGNNVNIKRLYLSKGWYTDAVKEKLLKLKASGKIEKIEVDNFEGEWVKLEDI